MNLQLSLTGKWFEMTDPNGKTEDYREINEYWAKRLCSSYPICSIDFHSHRFFVFKKFTHNKMTWGYPKSTDTSRIKIFEHAGVEIRTGNPEWGAEPDKLYFVIKHGKQIQ